MNLKELKWVPGIIALGILFFALLWGYRLIFGDTTSRMVFLAVMVGSGAITLLILYIAFKIMTAKQKLDIKATLTLIGVLIVGEVFVWFLKDRSAIMVILAITWLVSMTGLMILAPETFWPDKPSKRPVLS